MKGTWCNHHQDPFRRHLPPAMREGCECGMNWWCPVCGYGAGAIPCKCAPAPWQKKKGIMTNDCSASR